jgi:hypothetical protein
MSRNQSLRGETKMKTLVANTIFLLVSSIAAMAQITVDDFTAGAYSTPALTSGVDQQIQTGDPTHLLSGARRTYFTTATNPFGNLAQVKIGKLDGTNGVLTAQNGPRQYHRLELLYGVDPITGVLRPMHVNLSSYTRFRLTFNSNSTPEDCIIVVYYNNGSSHAQGAVNVPVNLSGGAFSLDIPFSSFGVDPTWNSIDYINVIFQSDSAIGANDFALSSITVQN